MTRPSSPPRRSLVVIALERPGRARRLHLSAGHSLLLGATLLLVGAWALGAAVYLSFREDVLSSMLARQASVRLAYEDRIAGLRAQIDRVTSRQLVDQDSFEGKMQELVARQAQLETRQAIVSTLMTQTAASLGSSGAATALTQGGVVISPGPSVAARTAAPPPLLAPLPPSRPAATAAIPAGAAAFAAPEVQPMPGGRSGPFADLPLRGSDQETAPSSSGAPSASAAPAPLRDRRAEAAGSGRFALFADASAGRRDPVVAGARLDHLSRALDGIAHGQEAALGVAEGAARSKAMKLRGLIAELGLDPGRLKAAAQAPMRNKGGPFVPLLIDSEDGLFGAAVERLQKTLMEAENLKAAVSSLPVGKPLPGDPEVTSGFGARVDPFTRGLALHTGLDLKEDAGTAVRATGPGTVTLAEWTGGYGNLVEIDHGNGLSSRYGHLSAILVSPGDHVAAGGVVGRVGSTGRSTGPHLHYETRIDGEPVDPTRFLRVARKINLSE